MERTTLLVFSSLGLVAVFLILLAERLGWPTFAQLIVHSATAAWVQAIGSIGAIAAAAWVVHRQHALHEAAERAQRISDKVDRINGVVLVLMRQFNALLIYRKQILEPERANAARHFALPPTLPLKFDAWQIDWRQFAYLAQTPAKDALMSAILAHDAFHSAVDLVNDRIHVHRRELQPLLEESGIDLSHNVSGASVAAAVGPRITHTLRVATDAVYDQVDLAIKLLGEVGMSVPLALRALYRGHPIIGFGTAPTAPTAEER